MVGKKARDYGQGESWEWRLERNLEITVEEKSKNIRQRKS